MDWLICSCENRAREPTNDAGTPSPHVRKFTYLRKKGVETVDLLSLLYIGVILGDTAEG